MLLLGPKDYLENFRNCRKAKEKGEMLPKLKKGKPRSLPGVVCSIYPQYVTLSCKTSKLNPAGNAAKHQEKLWKISVHAQKIPSQQIEYKN
jgi:energy-converting hydrogenase Eha subunit F